jgi:hypothetical protein
MELEDHNGDGRANPGELVRLFIALRNDTEARSARAPAAFPLKIWTLPSKPKA